MTRAVTTLESLPDEILMFIFSFICDIKDVLSCYLVSERVAYVISQCDRLRLKLFNPIHFPCYSYGTEGFILFENDDLLHTTTLLRLLSNVRTLQIEIPCGCRDLYGDAPCSSLFRWKAKVGRRFECLTYVGVDSIGISRDTSVARHHTANDEEMCTYDNVVARSYFEVGGPVCFALRMYQFMILLINRNHTLQSIELVDSEHHGSIVIRGMDLAQVRRSLDEDSTSFFKGIIDVNRHLKVWYEPTLRMEPYNIELHSARMIICRGSDTAEEVDNGIDRNVDAGLLLLGEFVDDDDHMVERLMYLLFNDHPRRAIIHL